jgi:hypothetical protein
VLAKRRVGKGPPSVLYLTVTKSADRDAQQRMFEALGFPLANRVIVKTVNAAAWHKLHRGQRVHLHSRAQVLVCAPFGTWCNDKSQL